MPLNHKVFLAQFETIKKIADRESCVIVGRCADYALADYPDCINIFIHSDMENRVKGMLGVYYKPLQFVYTLQGTDCLQARMPFDPNLR